MSTIDGNVKIHIDLETMAKEIAELSGSTDSMTYDEKSKAYYVNSVTEDQLKSLGFEYLCNDTEKRPIYKYYDILVSLSTSPANGTVTVYKDWKEHYLDYSYKEEVK